MGFAAMKILAPADWDEFRDVVSQFKPHVIHFSGHGSIASGNTDLIFRDRHTNESKPVGTGELTVFLRDRSVRLVVLTACDTSAVPAQGTFAVLAEALVRDGIPAVVASQLPLGNDTAVYCA